MTNLKLAKLTYFSFYFVALGVFVSVTVPSGYHIFAGIPLLIFSWKYLMVEKHKLPKSAWILLAFVLLSYIANFFNLDTLNRPMRSFGKQKYELFSIMTIMGLYYLRDYLSAAKWRKILNVFLFTIVAAAVYGIIKVIFQFDLLTMSTAVGGEELVRNGGFTEVMRYGYGTGFVLSMMLASIPFVKSSTLINKKWFWSALVAAVVGIYFAKTRGAILGVFVSIPVIVWFFKRKLGYGLATLGVVGMVLGLFLIQSGNFENRLFSKLGSGSNLKRLSQYEASIAAFTEKPLFGHGVNQFSSICPAVKKRHDIFWPEYCTKFPTLQCDHSHREAYCGHSHNVFLETATNRGVFALLAFVSFLLMWAYEMWKRQDAMTVVIFALLANFVVASQFEYTLNANNSFLFWFIYSISFIPLPKKYSLETIKG
tara:strand:- start:33174 stop:34448 length:1275 start_codon:yes stop_codon:yes gene_type:complete